MTTIRLDQVGGKTLDRAQKILAGIPGGISRASYAAAKRAGDTAKTKAGQFAAAEYTISKGTFMSNVNVKNRVYGGAGGEGGMTLSFAGSVLPLVKFSVKASKGGVSAKVKRHGGGGTLAHAFLASIFGSTSVFERLGASRFPVEQKFGPSTGHMMQNEKVIEDMSKTIEETYEKRMEQEIYRILAGFGG